MQMLTISLVQTLVAFAIAATLIMITYPPAPRGHRRSRANVANLRHPRKLANLLRRRLYADMAGPETFEKYKTPIYLAGSASAEFFADIGLCAFEAVKVRGVPRAWCPPCVALCLSAARNVLHLSAPYRLQVRR